LDKIKRINMKTDKIKWDETEIGTILILFPGEINQFLSHATPQEILRAKEYLPLILWRWYFLKSEIDNLSPYMYLDWRREVENWPKTGQFIPKAELTMPKPDNQENHKPKVKIDINIDYISFDEMPLFVDLKNSLEKKPFQYEFDSKYKIEVETLGKYLTKKVCDEFLENNNLNEIIEYYFVYCLFSWREENKDIQKAFSLEQWLIFWQKTMQKIQLRGQNEYGSDKLSDSFVREMRFTIKDYGVLTSQLEGELRGDRKHVRQWGLFWYDFCHFFLVPFSCYLPLLAPYFGLRENFNDDIKDILKNYHETPTPLYSAFNSLKFTPFGKSFFTNFELKKIYEPNNFKIN